MYSAVRYQPGCERESIGKGELVYSNAAGVSKSVSSKDSAFRSRDSPRDVSYLGLHREHCASAMTLEVCIQQRRKPSHLVEQAETAIIAAQHGSTTDLHVDVELLGIRGS